MAKIKPEPQSIDPPITTNKPSKVPDERSRIVKQCLQASLTAQSKVHDLLQETVQDLLFTRAGLESTQAELSQSKANHAATKRLLQSEEHDHESFWRGYFYEKHQNDVQELGQRITRLEDALVREKEKGSRYGDAQEGLKQLRGKWHDMSSYFGRGPEVRQEVVVKDEQGAETERGMCGMEGPE